MQDVTSDNLRFKKIYNILQIIEVIYKDANNIYK